MKEETLNYGKDEARKNTRGIDWKWEISGKLTIYEIHLCMYVHTHAFICTHLLALSTERVQEPRHPRNNMIPNTWILVFYYYSPVKGTRGSWRTGWFWSWGGTGERWSWNISLFQQVRECSRQTQMMGACHKNTEAISEVPSLAQSGLIYTPMSFKDGNK